MNKKPSESFREYAIRWREQATRVKPPMKDYELIDVFLQAQEPDYFLAAMGKTFAEAIKIGEMIENGISHYIYHTSNIKWIWYLPIEKRRRKGP